MATMQQAGLRPLTLAEGRELRMIVKASSERLDRVRPRTGDANPLVQAFTRVVDELAGRE